MFKLPSFLKFFENSQNPYEIIKRMSTYQKPQEEFIMSCIHEFEDSDIFKYRKICSRYFENDNDINKKERFYFDRKGQKIIDFTLSNVKLNHAIYRKMVNQKINYLLSKPFSIQSKNKDLVQLLNKYFNLSFLYTLQNTVRYSIITGLAWYQVYYNDKGKLCFKRHPESEIIPFWADSDHTILDAVIRRYSIMQYNPDGTKKEHIKIEYYTREGVWYYEQAEHGLIPDPDKGENNFKGHYQEEQNKITNNINELDEFGNPIKTTVEKTWDRIPFVAVKYNAQELPLLKFIKDLIDEYDATTSDNADSIHDIPSSVRVVKNYDGTDKDEFITNLKQLKLAFVSDDGDLTNLQIPLELDSIETHLKRIRKDIYENGCGVDTQDDNMRDTSGEALKFRYIDLSLDCQDIGVQVSRTLTDLAYFIKYHAQTYENLNIPDDVEFQIIYNVNMITNDAQTILDCKNSVGIVSNETILGHHPMVSDVEQEKERLQKEKEQQIKEQVDLEKQLSAYGSGGGSNE